MGSSHKGLPCDEEWALKSCEFDKKREKKKQTLDLWISRFYVGKTVKTTTGTYQIPEGMPHEHVTIIHGGSNIFKLLPKDKETMIEHGQYLSHISR